MRLFDRLLTKLLFAAMGFLPAMVSAQHLVYAEYYIDDDPGQGAAQSILPCDGVFDEAEEDFCVAGIATPSLDDGRHVFVLRMKDSEDRWGMRRMEFYSATSSPYAEKTLTAAEYFIDFDPGEGNGTELPASDGFLTDAIEHLAADSIASAELTLGWHTLYARVRDSYGVWSVARQVRFRVDESNSTKRIVAAECFVDTDPGVGKGMPLVAVDGSFDESLEAVIRDSIATGAFCAGDRTVYVRFCDNWSFWKASNGFTGWGPAAGAMLQVGSPSRPIRAARA